MNTKKCNKCGNTLPINLFNKHPSTSDGRQNQCRLCRNEVQRIYRANGIGNLCTKKYEKTESGFLMRLYRNMKSRITGIQKQKYHLYKGKYILPKEQFYQWALHNKEFKSLFKIYCESGFKIKLCPSIDRIDGNIGYEISNMRFVTQPENSANTSRNKRIFKGEVL